MTLQFSNLLCKVNVYVYLLILHKIWLASKVMKEWVMKLLQAKHFGAWKVNLGSKKKVHISTCQCYQLNGDLGLKFRIWPFKEKCLFLLSLNRIFPRISSWEHYVVTCCNNSNNHTKLNFVRLMSSLLWIGHARPFYRKEVSWSRTKLIVRTTLRNLFICESCKCHANQCCQF